MTLLVDRHRVACAGFSRVACQYDEQQWSRPTPCTEWDAARPRGARHRVSRVPLARAARRSGEPTEDGERAACRAAHAIRAVHRARDGRRVDRATELPGGGQSSPRTMLAALTTDVLVHTWDLARTIGLDPRSTPACSAAQLRRGAADSGFGDASALFAAAVAVADDADAPTRLIALYGRNPAWKPS